MFGGLLASIDPQNPTATFELSGQPVFPLAALAPLLLMLGGMIEAVITEYSFNQYWHFSAVVVKDIKHVGAIRHNITAHH